MPERKMFTYLKCNAYAKESVENIWKWEGPLKQKKKSYSKPVNQISSLLIQLLKVQVFLLVQGRDTCRTSLNDNLI